MARKTPIGPLHTVAVDGRTGVITIDLTPALRQRMDDAVRAVVYPENGGENAYVTTLRGLAYKLFPDDLLSIFDGVRIGASTPTGLVFTGLPFDKVTSAPAPGETARDRKPDDLSENSLVLLSTLFGEPYGTAGEGHRLVNDLVPTEEDRARYTGTGSEVTLSMHAEHAGYRRLADDRDLSPQGLLLTAVSVQEEGAPKTWIANGRMALGLVSAEHAAVLRQPAFQLAIPVRQRQPDHDPYLPAAPVVSGPQGGETITAALYGDMIRPLTEAAAEALKAYTAALDSVAVGAVLRPGSAMYIFNAYTLHGRDAFSPVFDDQGRAKRWLQRVFVSGRLDLFGPSTATAQRVFVLPQP